MAELTSADFFETGIQKIIPPYERINSGGDYVDKYLYSVCIFCL
jgi:hypothetical protein